MVWSAYTTQTFSQRYLSIALKIENLEYDRTGVVSKSLEKFGSKYLSNNFDIKIGNFEAKETENIWTRYLKPYKLDMKSPFVKNIELKNNGGIYDILYVQT